MTEAQSAPDAPEPPKPDSLPGVIKGHVIPEPPVGEGDARAMPALIHDDGDDQTTEVVAVVQEAEGSDNTTQVAAAAGVTKASPANEYDIKREADRQTRAAMRAAGKEGKDLVNEIKIYEDVLREQGGASDQDREE